MKKLTLIVISLALAVLLTACHGIKINLDQNIQNNKHETQITGERQDIDFILNRNIFVFKDNMPNIYNSVNDINTVLPYIEDWKFGRILNDKHFSGIGWSTDNIGENERVITFSGESKYGSDVLISFYVQDGAGMPLAISSRVTDADSSTTLMNIQSFMDRGMGYEDAMVATDASISILLAFWGENPIDENTSTNNSFDSFVDGDWYDLYSQRCNLSMNVVDNETVQIEINWSSGAAYNTVWNFTGKWDSNTGRLNYENGVMFDYEYVEGQEEAKIIGFYFDGTGYFYFEDGYLYWVDHKENAGANCYFEQSSE